MNLVNNNYSRKNNISFGKDKLVYLCSPLASGFEQSQECPDIKSYIRRNMQKAIDYASIIFKNGDIPTWHHSTWPYFVNDTIPEQRKRALEGCLALVKRCDALCYFGEPKGGMLKEIELAKKMKIPVIKQDELKDIDQIVERSPRYQQMKNWIWMLSDNRSNAVQGTHFAQLKLILQTYFHTAFKKISSQVATIFRILLKSMI